MSLASVKLGLIGDNIARSKSPLLHTMAGTLVGLDVTYNRLIPKTLHLGFKEVFAQVQDSGYRGVNVTYPYKEQVVAQVRIDDPLVRAMGAVNTVVFDKDGPVGFNTDYTGFMATYRAARGDALPGHVCLIGTGGVGKAVAFGLVALGAEAITCVDLDRAKADRLADALRALGSGAVINASSQPDLHVDGIINCTPLGMDGIGGAPVDADAMRGASWAFDAVYTPADTKFLMDATRVGLSTISGYELFFHQGVAAWTEFTGTTPDHNALRAALQGDAP